MKKLLILGTLFLGIAAIASFGGYTAHAQTTQGASTVSPEERAMLEEQLQVLKAKLIELQLQAGQIPAPEAPSYDTPAPASVSANAGAPMSNESALSATDLSALNNALTSFTNLLIALQAKINADPNFSATNGPVIAASLGRIGQTLALASRALATNGQNVVPNPSTPDHKTAVNVAVPNLPSVSVTPVAPSPVAQAPVSAPVAQTASTFSIKNLNWPIILVVLLAVAAIALWLWWPEESETAPAMAKKPSKPSPSQPTVVVSSYASAPTAVGTPAKQTAAATPVATVVAIPKPETTNGVRVMPPRPDQRKTA